MPAVTLPFDGVRASATSAAERIAALLRVAPDGSAAVPGLQWTIGVVGAHLVSVARGYLDFAHGAETSLFSRDPAEVNADRLAEYMERDTKRLADELGPACDAFLSAIAEDDSRMTLVGIPADRGTAAGALLGELLVHGLDIARAAKARWTIDPAEARMAFCAGMSFLPVFVDPAAARAFSATFVVRPRGGEPVTLTFTNGALEISSGRTKRADCVIAGNPVSMLLAGYGRIPQWKAALGGNFAYGRKPWLALRFQRLFKLP